MIRLGLRGEILVAFVLVTVFAIGLNTLVVLQLDSIVLRQERLLESRELARVAADALRPPHESKMLPRLMDELSDAMAAQIAGPDGTIQGSAGVAPEKPVPGELRAAAEHGETHTSVAGLLAEGGVIVRVTTPIPGTREALVLWRRIGGGAATKRARRLTLLYIVLDALIAGAFGWYLISRSVVRPLTRLTEATRRIASGEREVSVPTGAPNELGDLARDFNHMTGVLAEKEAQLARQVKELTATNAQLRAAREEVVQSEKLASVGRLAAGVAHELGNPVGAVTGYVSAMRRDRAGKNDPDSEMLERIEREMGRIDRIIRDLLDYARPRPQSSQPIDLDEAADAALAIVSVQKSFKSIAVERVRGAAGGGFRVDGDGHRLQQVLVNLLINAADAMESAPEKRLVVETLRTEFPEVAAGRRREDRPVPSGTAFAVRVRDSGSGIASEHIAMLFDPFFTTKEPGRGTGLGLAISRTIVESMGGRIHVESEPGKGATFTVLLAPAAEAVGRAEPGSGTR